MATTWDPRHPRRSGASLLTVLLPLAVLIVMAVAVGSWLQFTERQALDTVHMVGSQGADRVDVEANVQRVDAAARELALRVRVTARGALGEEEGTAPVADLSLQTSAQTLGDLEFKAHERLTTRDVQVVLTDGSISDYPFDTYETDIEFWAQLDGKPVPVRMLFSNNDPLFTTLSLRTEIPDPEGWYRALAERMESVVCEAGDADSSGWDTVRLLAPHALTTARLTPDARTAGRTLNRASDSLCQAGHPEQAAALAEQALGRLQPELGNGHPDTLTSRNNLATALQDLGRHQEAADLHQQTLTDRERVLEPDHRDTLASRNNLATALQDLGRYQEAADLHRQNLTDHERTLGPNHPHTLGSRNNLANTFRELGRYQEAADLHQQTLTDRERILGPDHPHTLGSRNHLAQIGTSPPSGSVVRRLLSRFRSRSLG
ncbi:tetratricopeptide repeat protein [Streptomyces sp. NPDC058701]|uniref:tetratricopeptide repeat protein n=1 Tax=Streptomyces sp. NPDC058701 TaxID=3346608 RepID=UPI00364D0262